MYPLNCEQCNNSNDSQYQDFKRGTLIYAIYYTARTEQTPNTPFNWYILDGGKWVSIYTYDPGQSYQCCAFSYITVTAQGCYKVEFGGKSLEFSVEAAKCCERRRWVPVLSNIPCPNEKMEASTVKEHRRVKIENIIRNVDGGGDGR